MATTSSSVCVLGAGVVGLSTAVRIQEEIPGVSVTLMAAQFSPHTTSDGAAGFWEPYMMEDTQPHLIRKWGDATFEHMIKLAFSKEGPEAGTFLVPCYSLFTSKPELPIYKDTVLSFREMSLTEVQKQFPAHMYGYSFITAISECRKYLPWLMKWFKSNGGKVIKKEILHLSQVPHTFDVVVNCTGLGSSRLLGDKQLKPIRGQVLRVHAPYLKTAITDDGNDVYILPCENSVVLGGTHDPGQWDTTVNEKEKERILRGCANLVPGIESAPVLADWVGLRPARSQVRLEKETIDCGCNRRLKVVHNYGHGGGGITLHWGCAADAALLVQELLNSVTSKL